MSCLHVLNGDGLQLAFDQTGIAGSCVIWREALCSGPVHPEAGSEAFVRLRETYLSQLHTAGPSYRQYVLPELEKLRRLAPQAEEVVLWFGAEYFCQINLMGALSLLAALPQPLRISLVCTGHFPGLGAIKCLGDLSPPQLATLWPGRLHLQQQELALAARCWHAFACGHAPELYELQRQADFGQLGCLQSCITTYLELFPHTQHALTGIEWQILGLFEQQAPWPWQQLMRKLLQQDLRYGFGDLQLEQLLADMSPLILRDEQDLLSLSPHGREVLAGKQKAHLPAHASRWNGGAPLLSYRWNAQARLLEPA